jgi:hypothetical protein
MSNEERDKRIAKAALLAVWEEQEKRLTAKLGRPPKGKELRTASMKAFNDLLQDARDNDRELYEAVARSAVAAFVEEHHNEGAKPKGRKPPRPRSKV